MSKQEEGRGTPRGKGGAPEGGNELEESRKEWEEERILTLQSSRRLLA